MKHTQQKGFTLIELLVVIAIIGILAAVILLAINPAEMLRKTRDSARLQEITNLKKGIDSQIATETANILEPVQSANRCTFADPCNSSTGTRNIEGTGWLPLDLQDYIPVLPVDPRDNISNTRIATGIQATPRIWFATDGSAYKLGIYMESSQNTNLLINDGGTDSTLYELGTTISTAMTLN